MSRTVILFSYLFAILLFMPAAIKAQELFSSSTYRISFLTESGYHKLNDTPLNVDNELVPQIRYNSYSSADIFVNWRFLTCNLKGEMNYTDRDRPDYNASVRELYFDHPFGDNFHFTIGRKILRWGTGYAFNPTGVVEPVKSAVDPSDRLNCFKGRQIIGFDAYWSNYSLTLIYSNEVRYNGSIKWGDDEFATRIYTLFKNVDISVVGHWRHNKKSQYGFNIAYTYGEHWEFHGEFNAQKGSDKLYHQVLDSTQYKIYFDSYPYTARFQNSSSIFYKVLVGAQYIFDSGLNFMAEYFYNREGLTRKEWNRWRQFILFHQQQIITTPPNLRSIQNFYSALATLNYEGTMRNYGFFRLYLPKQKYSFEFLTFMNLGDGSGVMIHTFNYSFNSNIKAWLRTNYFWGENDSEFGMLFSKAVIQTGMKLSF